MKYHNPRRTVRHPGGAWGWVTGSAAGLDRSGQPVRDQLLAHLHHQVGEGVEHPFRPGWPLRQRRQDDRHARVQHLIGAVQLDRLAEDVPETSISQVKRPTLSAIRRVGM